MFWPFRVSRFVTVPTYLSTYLPTYLSIHRFVKVASRFSLLNHRIPSIACLFETFLRASEFSKTKCIVSALPCAPPPLPPLCFEFRKSSLRERLSWNGARIKDFFFFWDKVSRRNTFVFSFRNVSEIIKDRCVVYERKKMTINKWAGINGIYFKQIAVKIISSNNYYSFPRRTVFQTINEER